MNSALSDDWVVALPRDVEFDGLRLIDRALGTGLLCEPALAASLSRADGCTALGELDPGCQHRATVMALNQCGLLNLVIPPTMRFSPVRWRSVRARVRSGAPQVAYRHSMRRAPLAAVPFGLLAALFGRWWVAMVLWLFLALTLSLSARSVIPAVYLVLAGLGWLSVVIVHELGHVCAMPRDDAGRRRFFALFEGARLSMVTVAHGASRDALIAGCGPCACLLGSLAAAAGAAVATTDVVRAMWSLQAILFLLGASSLMPWADDGRRILHLVRRDAS